MMNKIWLIGASEGIGRAVAKELGKNVDNFLILSARKPERLVSLASEIESKSMICPVDVSDSHSVKEGWKEISNKLETIDTVIYCAGYYKPMTVENIDIDEIERMIDVNLVGAVRMLGHIIPEFISKKNGHIVLISSIAGYRGLPNDTGYGSSKAGLIHLAENLNCDLSGYGIKVQLISPGFVKTRLTDLNNFKMPSLISTEKAAIHIKKAIESKSFEIRFPFLFASSLKMISLLPYVIYFWLIRQIKKLQ